MSPPGEQYPDESEAEGPTSALPSVGARVLAFGSIVVGGICGGLIGFAFVDLQCDDGCTTQAGIAGVISALLFAAGVGIVATLALRAMGEWETIKERDATADQIGSGRADGE